VKASAELVTDPGWENRLMNFETSGELVQYRYIAGELREMRTVNEVWEDSIFFRREGTKILGEYSQNGVLVPFGSIEIDGNQVIVTDTQSVLEAKGAFSPTILEQAQVEFFLADLLLEQRGSIHGILLEELNLPVYQGMAFRKVIDRLPEATVETTFIVMTNEGQEMVEPKERKSILFEDGKIQSIRREVYDEAYNSFRIASVELLNITREPQGIFIQQEWGTTSLTWKILN
jgi:hypothetical protein